AKYRGQTAPRGPFLHAAPSEPDTAGPGGGGGDATPAPTNAEDASQLAQALGLPPSKVEQKMAVIARKLGGRAQPISWRSLGQGPVISTENQGQVTSA